MTLFSSLNVGLRGLLAHQSAMRTVGHNISNAETPGFSRQRVEFGASLSQDLQFAQLGTGVNIIRIRRIVDEVLELRLQDGTQDYGYQSIRQQSFERLEGLLNALSETDLGAALQQFFAALHDVANHPESVPVRTAAVELAQTLANQMNALSERIRDERERVNNDVVSIVARINSFTTELADLNQRILETENGGQNPDSANDLRDRRGWLLRELSELVRVRVIEDSRGQAHVLAGSNYLVFANEAYRLDTRPEVQDGLQIDVPYYVDSNAELEILGGQLRGLVESRDTIQLDVFNELRLLARALIFEFNKVHTEGTGLVRHQDLTSAEAVHNLSVPVGGTPLATNGTATSVPTTTTVIDSSLAGLANDIFNGLEIMILSGVNAGERRTITDFDGGSGTIYFDREFEQALSVGDQFQLTSLPFELRNGSFDLVVTNELTGVESTFNITMDLDGDVPGDTTLQDVVNELNAEAGALVTASVTSADRLRLASNSTDYSFRFANDTSDFLASIGMSTLFVGTDGRSMAVNDLILSSPELFAAGLSNAPGDNANVLRMTALREQAVLSNGTATFEEYYTGLVETLAARTQEAQTLTENSQLMLEQMENERQRISGVNVDEEAVNMITFQRAFQAMARFILVVDQMLDTLINTV